MIAFNQWLDTFIEEKGIDTDHTFEFDKKDLDIDAQANMNFIVETHAVISWIKKLDPETKAKIKDNFVKIDFFNGDPMHFMEFMAKGMIKATQKAYGY